MQGRGADAPGKALDPDPPKSDLPQSAGKRDTTGMKFFPALNEAPDLGMEYMRLKRNLLTEEAIYELLTKEKELAKIEESRDLVAFQVLDPARVPQKKCSPIILLNAGIGGAVGLFCAVFIILFMEYLKRLRAGDTGGGSDG